jgi:hypothetical protein
MKSLNSYHMNGHSELAKDPFANSSIIWEKLVCFDLQEELRNICLAIERSGYEPPKSVDQIEKKEYMDRLDKAGLFKVLFPTYD